MQRPASEVEKFGMLSSPNTSFNTPETLLFNDAASPTTVLITITGLYTDSSAPFHELVAENLANDMIRNSALYGGPQNLMHIRVTNDYGATPNTVLNQLDSQGLFTHIPTNASVMIATHSLGGSPGLEILSHLRSAPGLGFGIERTQMLAFDPLESNFFEQFAPNSPIPIIQAGRNNFDMNFALEPANRPENVSVIDYGIVHDPTVIGNAENFVLEGLQGFTVMTLNSAARDLSLTNNGVSLFNTQPVPISLGIDLDNVIQVDLPTPSFEVFNEVRDVFGVSNGFEPLADIDLAVLLGVQLRDVEIDSIDFVPPNSNPPPAGTDYLYDTYHYSLRFGVTFEPGGIGPEGTNIPEPAFSGRCSS